VAKVLVIDTCAQCHHHIFDDGNVIERYGKFWCTVLDFEVQEAGYIPDACPLPENTTNE